MTDAVGGSSGSSGLEVLWAPVLLLHLGGHVTLSAFSLEDNELWIRHVITLVSQVLVALYVFCKWWAGELRLLLAAVMLFFFGILKFSLKPWALRRASYSQMLASIDVSLPEGAEDGATRDSALSLDEYVTQAKATMCAARCHQQGSQPPAVIAIRHIDYFVDLSTPYGGRLSDLRYLQDHQYKKKKKKTTASCKMLQTCLHDTFNLLYTRVGESLTFILFLLVVLLPFLALASVVLFATSHKHGYNSRDIKVTYILFSCTTMLEFLLPLGALVCAFPCLRFVHEYMNGWHDMVSQYNLMSFYVRKKKPTLLMKIAFFECLREYVSKVWYVRQVPAACEITELVERYIEEDGWKTFISDATTYRRFSNFRGQLTLKRFSDQQCDLGEELWHSLKVPFDKSILLWHMASNLCFYLPVDKLSPFLREQSHLTRRSIEMSDYMLYLLFIRPEMLLPGTRPGQFTAAIHELDNILKNSEAKFIENEAALAKEIIKHTDGSTLIHQACRLAVALMKLDEDEMWEIIQGVWVEMLCYSASRSRGGEYLSYVWPLWSYMGMETLADKIQKPPSPTEKEILAADAQLLSSSQGGLSRQSWNGGISSPV